MEGVIVLNSRHQKETSCEPETLQDTNFTFDGEPLYYSGKIGEIMHEYCLDTGYCVIAIIHDNVIEFTSKVGDIEVDHQRLYPLKIIEFLDKQTLLGFPNGSIRKEVDKLKYYLTVLYSSAWFMYKSATKGKTKTVCEAWK